MVYHDLSTFAQQTQPLTLKVKVKFCFPQQMSEFTSQNHFRYTNSLQDIMMKVIFALTLIFDHENQCQFLFLRFIVFEQHVKINSTTNGFVRHHDFSALALGTLSLSLTCYSHISFNIYLLLNISKSAPYCPKFLRFMILIHLHQGVQV